METTRKLVTRKLSGLTRITSPWATGSTDRKNAGILLTQDVGLGHRVDSSMLDSNPASIFYSSPFTEINGRGSKARS